MFSLLVALVTTVVDATDVCRISHCGCSDAEGSYSEGWCDDNNSKMQSEWCNINEGNCEGTCGGSFCPVDCLSSLKLSDFEVWRREEGYWFGEYTLLGAEGNPFVSTTWNYPYDHYFGFIHIELIGNALKQRNVFIYPPQDATTCASDFTVSGAGVCGVNGNEKVFSADQTASDCTGNLAGPYPYGAYTLDTTTTILGDDTVVYAVKLPAAFGGGFNQNQLTTLPGNGVRVRTAQGFDFAGQPSYVSFYRETKLADKAAFEAKLAEVRAATSILAADYCGFDSSNAPSGVTCQEHFGF